MTRIIRPDGGVREASKVLAALRTASGEAAVAAAQASPPDALRAWLETAREPGLQVGGLTLVQWSALLPESDLWEGFGLGREERSALETLLRPQGGAGPVDHAATAGREVERLFAAGSRDEMIRAHAVLALHALRIGDEEAAREPVLLLATLEVAAGRPEIADALMSGRSGLREQEFRHLLQRIADAAERSPELFAPLAEACRALGRRMLGPAREEAAGEATPRMRRAQAQREAPPPPPVAAPAPGRTAPPPEEISTAGTVLFNPPERMKVGRTDRIEVRLGDATTSIEALKERLRGKGAARTETIEIASRMRVQLLADPEDFDIRALNHDDQLIRPGQPAHWDFDVTPKRDGLRLLRLLVSIRARIGNDEEIVDLPALERSIEVEVSPLFSLGRFMGRHWQWFVTALFVPFVLWFLNASGMYRAVGDWFRQMFR